MLNNIIRKLQRLPERLKLTLFALYRTSRVGGFSSFEIKYIKPNRILEGKKVLVTGGSSGIGLAIAEEFSDQGARVVVTGRSLDRLEKIFGGRETSFFNYIEWDVTDLTLTERKLAECRNILNGDIDILINNAGVVNGIKFPNVKESDWDEIYQINSKALFFLTQAVCRYWISSKKRKLKKIINISSQGAYVGALYPYRMSKWDLSGLTEGLGKLLAPKKIIVNAIAPGITATKAVSTDIKNDNIYCAENPLGRVALPKEIAGLASYIASDASNFIVGQTIICDGGYSLK